MTMPTPSYLSIDGTTYDAVSSDEGFGPMLTAAITGRPRTVLELVYAPGQLDATTAAALVAVWDGASGSAGTFTMTDYQSEMTGTWRFVDDDLTLDVESVIAYGCTVRVVKESF